MDQVKAYAWLSLAVKNDVEPAKKALSILSEKMSLSEISRAKAEIVDLERRLNRPDVASPVPPRPGQSVNGMPENVNGTELDANADATRIKRRSARMMRRR